MKDITIIGAGVSGLVCAIELEKSGFKPLIIDKAQDVGGRLTTSFVNGFYLDHGFQVLLTAYPAVQEYLDLDKLQLKKFLPGAIIYTNQKKHLIGDAFRQPSFLIPTVFSSMANLTDKLKMLKLSFEMKQSSVEEIFNKPESTTIDYLRDYGFSNHIINGFFKPFYSGIFLESNLDTSSRMFEFIFKMFAEGSAAIPEKGMISIAHQLKGKLNHTDFRLDTCVNSVTENKVILEGGEELHSDIIVLASTQHLLGDNQFTLLKTDKGWNGCSTFYFEYTTNDISSKIISLIAEPDCIIANLYRIQNDKGGSVLTVTVIDNAESKKYKELENQVRKELMIYCKIDVGKCLAVFDIPFSLPVLDNLSYQPSIENLKISDSLYVCGDQTANASLNAAMLSGKIVAKEIIENI